MFFLTPFIVSTVASQAFSITEEEKAFQAMCDKHPEGDRLREERRIRRKKEEDHRKKLEIARESRPLNFWGCR